MSLSYGASNSQDTITFYHMCAHKHILKVVYPEQNPIRILSPHLILFSYLTIVSIVKKIKNFDLLGIYSSLRYLNETFIRAILLVIRVFIA